MINFFLKTLNSTLLKLKIKSVEQDLKKVVGDVFNGDFWIYRYGEYKPDTSKLVFWICAKTDEKKSNITGDAFT